MNCPSVGLWPEGIVYWKWKNSARQLIFWATLQPTFYKWFEYRSRELPNRFSVSRKVVLHISDIVSFLCHYYGAHIYTNRFLGFGGFVHAKVFHRNFAIS